MVRFEVLSLVIQFYDFFYLGLSKTVHLLIIEQTTQCRVSSMLRRVKTHFWGLSWEEALNRFMKKSHLKPPLAPNDLFIWFDDIADYCNSWFDAFNKTISFGFEVSNNT